MPRILIVLCVLAFLAGVVGGLVEGIDADNVYKEPPPFHPVKTYVVIPVCGKGAPIDCWKAAYNSGDK
jgi:hypothetical protein